MLISTQLIESGKNANAMTTSNISWLVIPTCDRVLELHRAILSFGTSIIKYGHSLNIFVSDNSRVPTAQRENRDLLTALASSHNLRIYYAGYDEKVDFCKLCDSRIPSEVTRFALLGQHGVIPAMGANRNATLLQTVGNTALSADDDTEWITGRAKGSKTGRGAIFSRSSNVAEITAFEDRAAAVEEVSFSDIDVITEHESMLGTAFPVRNGSLGHSGLVGNSTFTVRLTSNGVVGDSGFESQKGVICWEEPATRKRMFKSDRSARLALETREVVRQVRRRTVARGGECLATVMGFDNREVLPPFFPHFRGEDNLFGLMLGCCDVTSVIGYLPFVVVHAPPEHRHSPPTNLAVVNVCEIIGWLCIMWARCCEYNDVRSRLRSLGRFLTGIASMPVEDFEAALREVLEMRSRHLTLQLEQQIRVAFLPDVWKSAIQGAIESLTKNSISNVIAMEPRKVEAKTTLVSSTLIREVTLSYGELLKWWIPLLEVARDLANAGMGVGNPVFGK